MNRYEIKNKRTGLVTHVYEQDTPPEHHPLFGDLERLKLESECSELELSESLETIVETDPETGIEKVLRRLPQNYEVIITDLTPVIEEQNQRRTQIRTLRQAVKTILLKQDADVTAAEVKTALLKFLRAALLKGDLE